VLLTEITDVHAGGFEDPQAEQVAYRYVILVDFRDALSAGQFDTRAAGVAERERQTARIQIEGLQDHPVLLLGKHVFLIGEMTTQARTEAFQINSSGAERG
jgi:hypothetical protein